MTKPFSVTSVAVPINTDPLPDFVKVEKNLNTLGFFSPAKSRSLAIKTEKIVRFRREVNGRVVDAQATILPSAKYGLPTTADLDKYLAFQKIISDIRQRQGHVSNPVGFTSSRMLTVLGIKDAGNNYQDIHDWLQRMTLTGISSKGVVYLAKRKAWASDTFHVFDRVVALGMQMPDGTVADRNYVWLSDWQLENINGNYLLPVDFDAYRKLRNHIAKVLVPLLQLWLYASRAEGRFEKKYGDLCEILNITCHKHTSLIKRQLEPSLSELEHHGYLASYSIEPTADGREYKMVAVHGHKFYRDQKIRAGLPAATIAIEAEPNLLQALTCRGIMENQAKRLLKALPPNQPIFDQLEYADSLIAMANRSIANPPGFYVYVLREDVRPPAHFETTTRRRAREQEEHARAQQQLQHLTDQQEYEQYCEDEVQARTTSMPRSEYDALIDREIRQLKTQWSNLPRATLQEMAEAQVRRGVRAELSLLSVENFADRNKQARLF